MKIKFLSALLFSFLLIASCSDNGSSTDNGNGTPSSSELKVNLSGDINENYSVPLPFIFDLPQYVTENNENISVLYFVMTFDNEKYTFYMAAVDYDSQDGVREGEYNVIPVDNSGEFPSQEAATMVITEPGTAAAYTSTGGSLKITHYGSDYITGTFNITLTSIGDSNKTVTAEGSFSYIK